MTDPKEKIRVTAELPIDEVRLLRDLAARQNITLTEALRRAIATDGLLQERRATGSKVLLEQNGKMTELVFHR